MMLRSWMMVVVFVACGWVARGAEEQAQAWRTDFTEYVKKLQSGGSFDLAQDAGVQVRWKMTFLSARKERTRDGDDLYLVQFDYGRIENVNGTYELVFECDEREFATWKQVNRGAKVDITAVWSHYFLSIPRQPVKTWFRSTRIAKPATN